VGWSAASSELGHQRPEGLHGRPSSRQVAGTQGSNDGVPERLCRALPRIQRAQRTALRSRAPLPTRSFKTLFLVVARRTYYNTTLDLRGTLRKPSRGSGCIYATAGNCL
jgi:hypothetical protein